EGIHELDFARSWQVQLCPEVVRLYRYDAPNRVMLPSLERLYAQAADFAKHAEATLARHGPGLTQLTPTTWTAYVRQAALFRYLEGDRRRGTQHSVTLLRRYPTILRGWIVLIFGLIGRGPLAVLYLSLLRGRVAG